MKQIRKTTRVWWIDHFGKKNTVREGDVDLDIGELAYRNWIPVRPRSGGSGRAVIVAKENVFYDETEANHALWLMVLAGD